MTKELTPDDIIDALGGTSEVARLCEIQPPSVSEWRRNGIPKSQLKFLRLARPDVFEDPIDASLSLTEAASLGGTSVDTGRRRKQRRKQLDRRQLSPEAQPGATTKD